MFFMHKLVFLLVFICTSVFAEPIYHEKKYPDGKGPFPTVLILHTSGAVSYTHLTLPTKRIV